MCVCVCVCVCVLYIIDIDFFESLRKTVVYKEVC